MKQKLAKLHKGGTVGVISPSGALKDSQQVDNAVKYFESKGFKVKVAPHALDKKDYLAGSDADRLADLENFFKDDEIKAIMCTRGGYGAFRILEKIDYDLIKDNPKIFIGYSDITAFLTNFVEKSNLVTFHGPLFTSDFGADEVDSYTEENFWKAMSGEITAFSNPYEYHCIKPGTAEGQLIGGNLAILCGLLGTPYMPDLSGKILFLEDIGEPMYKIDRLITQLKLSGVLDNIAGLLFCEFSGVDENPIGLISELVQGLNIPIGHGFPAGHEKQKATLPLGITYRFDSENFKLEIAESYIKN